MIVSAQLLFTFFVSLLTFFSTSFSQFQMANLWLFVLVTPVCGGIMYTITCYPKVARSYPLNYILLGIFTLCESYIV